MTYIYAATSTKYCGQIVVDSKLSLKQVDVVCAGSMDSEAGVYAMTFDQSGSRLITCDADKTIKIYKEDDMAVSIFTLLYSFYPAIINRSMIFL